jgi:hypothetical protein
LSSPLGFFAGHGVTARRLQTDNAFAYIRKPRPLVDAMRISDHAA